MEGNVVTLGNGKTGVKQSKETEAKVQSDYLLTYTNTWGDHSLTATAGFTTYYNKLEMLESEKIMDCIECGSCSFTCPANRPLLDVIRLAKARTGQMIRSRKK